MTRTSTVTASLCSAMIIGTLMSPATAVASECKQWDARGHWQLQQASFTVNLESIDQVGQNLTGNARYLTKESLRGPNGLGPVDGTILGDTIFFKAYWSSGAVGVYEGTVGPTGRVAGITFEESSPGKKVKWHSVQRLSCLSSAHTSTPPAKITKRLGKKKAPLDPQASGLGEAGKVITTESASDCKPGFVKRLTRAEDDVCVTPEAHDRILQENSEGAYYVDPNGSYGPTSCITGYVWRDAYNGDGVCVTPEARETAKQENLNSNSNRLGG